MNKISVFILTASIFIVGCTATTRFDSVQSDVTIKVNKWQEIVVAEKTEKKYQTTSFGQFKFKAEKEGLDPMYGLIPLKFNGGYLAADILFFAPAMFFNLREVFPFYQFDLEKNEVRYKKKAADEWTVYTPTPKEIEHAQRFFGE